MYRVLAVEDNAMNVKLLKAILREPDFDLTSVESAEEAFVSLKISKPDLILMDLGLPGIDGYEAITRLKNDLDFKSIPVVAVSAFARFDEQEKARTAGAVDFISKPIDVLAFAKQVMNYVAPKNKPDLN